MRKIPDNQIAFYQSPDGSVNVEVLYAEENIWLTQKKMAELFDTTPQNITQHLKNIYMEGEVNQEGTCKNFLQVQQEGDREVKRNESGINGNNVDFDVSIVVEQESSGKVRGKVGASILNVISANIDSKLDQTDSHQNVNRLKFKVWVSENEMK